MNKILLCGNGINIKFNKKYQLKDFIETLKNEEKLINYINNIINIINYQILRNFNLEFISIVKNCNKGLKEFFENLKSKGVEDSITIFFKTVKEWLKLRGPKEFEQKSKKFEDFFRVLFFYYIYSLEEEQEKKISSSQVKNTFINKLVNDYLMIYTLNYDSVLEKILLPKGKKDEDIRHLHGKILFNDKTQNLNFDDCKLESFQSNKTEYFLENLFVDKDLKNAFELDIIGVNPVNDENIFALFINSESSSVINYYFHNENDLLNFEKTLAKIQPKWLKTEMNNKKIIFENESDSDKFKFKYEKKNNKKYLLFLNDSKIVLRTHKFSASQIGGISLETYERNVKKTSKQIEINLIHTCKFWYISKNCKEKICGNAFQKDTGDTLVLKI